MKKNYFLTLLSALFGWFGSAFAEDFSWEINPANESQLEEISTFQIKYNMPVAVDWPESIIIYRNGVLMQGVSVSVKVGEDNKTCTYTLNKTLTEQGTYSIRHLDWSVSCAELGEDLPEIEITYYIGEPQELDPVVYVSPAEGALLSSLCEVLISFENVKNIEVDPSKRVQMLAEGVEEGEGMEYFLTVADRKSVFAAPVSDGDDRVIRKGGKYTLWIEDGAILLDGKPYGYKLNFNVVEHFDLLESSPAEGSTVEVKDLEQIVLTFNKKVVGYTSFMLKGLTMRKHDENGEIAGDVGFYTPAIDKDDARKVILTVDQWGLDIEEEGEYSLNLPPTAFISEDGDKNLAGILRFNVVTDTAIGQIVSQSNGEVYNLQGMKVDSSELAPGFYIIGGKTVLVK